ncbi:unnamed protein product [Urochloa humidicola]
MADGTYSKWVSFFKTMSGKFGLKSHINGTLPAQPNDPIWDQADCCVRMWMYGSVDNSVLDLAMNDDEQIARELWVAIEALFCANKPSKDIFLSEDFHSMQQGDDSISEYAGRMKKVVADLRHADHPVQQGDDSIS